MKKSIFNNRWLPYLLVAPQMIIVLVFFFWPAFDSLRLSVYKVSPFGDRQIFVGLENFIDLLTSPEYYRSVYHSFIFSLGVTFSCSGRIPLPGLLSQPENPRPHLLPLSNSLDLWRRSSRRRHHLALYLSSILRDSKLPPGQNHNLRIQLASERMGCPPPDHLCSLLGSLRV